MLAVLFALQIWFIWRTLQASAVPVAFLLGLQAECAQERPRVTVCVVVEGTTPKAEWSLFPATVKYTGAATWSVRSAFSSRTPIHANNNGNMDYAKNNKLQKGLLRSLIHETKLCTLRGPSWDLLRLRELRKKYWMMSRISIL